MVDSNMLLREERGIMREQLKRNGAGASNTYAASNHVAAGGHTMAFEYFSTTPDSDNALIAIPLTLGFSCVVNAVDADLSLLKWVSQQSASGIYAIHNQTHKPKLWMHRVILSRMLERELVADEYVDHIDGNTLDNRRDNLRSATRAQNLQNHKVSRRNKSGVTGVCWHKRSQVWTVQISVHRRLVYLGTFRDLDEAAEVRRQAEIKYFGAFAPSRKQGDAK